MEGTVPLSVLWNPLSDAFSFSTAEWTQSVPDSQEEPREVRSSSYPFLMSMCETFSNRPAEYCSNHLWLYLYVSLSRKNTSSLYWDCAINSHKWYTYLLHQMPFTPRYCIAQFLLFYMTLTLIEHHLCVRSVVVVDCKHDHNPCTHPCIYAVCYVILQLKWWHLFPFPLNLGWCCAFNLANTMRQKGWWASSQPRP